MSKSSKVYPIPGRFIVGEALIEQEVDAAEADRLVATGVFARSQKEAEEAAFTTPEATPATDENVKPKATDAGEPVAAAAEPEPAPKQE